MFINGKTSIFLLCTYLKMLSKDFKNFGVEKLFFQITILWCSPTYSKREGFTMVENSVLGRRRVQAIAVGAICFELERACGKLSCQGRLWPDGRKPTEGLAEHLDSGL